MCLLDSLTQKIPQQMKINNLDLQQKLQALLLNKVDGLKWYYFNLDLNVALEKGVYISDQEIKEFFIDIQTGMSGRYEYQGTETDMKALEAKVLCVLLSLIRSNPEILTQVVMRLFDINKITNDSESDLGFLGKLNKSDTKRRAKDFRKLMRDGFRSNPENIVLLAEGDSWFQFPKIYITDVVKDIIDHLIEDKQIAVKSLAAAGDWLSNIFYSGDYVEELPKISPDAFLISGGGNDLVEDFRLSIMVISPGMEELKTPNNNEVTKQLYNLRKDHEAIDQEKYLRGISFFSDEFIDFINIYFVQYFVFLYGLCHVEKYKKMLILTQGYDFAIPHKGNRGAWISLRRLVNWQSGTGKWLFEPLNQKGITNKEDQEAIVYAMIYEFNEMLVQLATFNGMPNLFHIDCRGVAKRDDWYDELHLKSRAYEKVASVYKRCIIENRGMKNPSANKVYRVVDFDN